MKDRLRGFLIIGIICGAITGATAADKSSTGEPPNATASDSVDIPWQSLAGFLPNMVEGLKAGSVEGQSRSAEDPGNPGVQYTFTAVEREYLSGTDNNQKMIRVKLLDAGHNPMLIGPYLSRLEYDSETGGMKVAEINGHQALSLYEKTLGKVVSRQIIIMLAERILVEVEGNRLVSEDELISVAENLDLKGIAETAKQ